MSSARTSGPVSTKSRSGGGGLTKWTSGGESSIVFLKLGWGESNILLMVFRLNVDLSLVLTEFNTFIRGSGDAVRHFNSIISK